MSTSTDHPAGLATAERGAFVIADISGYTGYLMGSELEHAHDVLADLIETVVNNLQPVLRLSKLEGDAAFAYQLESAIEPSMLLDTIDRAYFAFRTRLRDIQQATTCTCNACILIPALNLKFVAHHGSFIRRKVAGNEELTGTDVIVVHRLLKNTVANVFELHGYALLSGACVRAMGIDAEALGMRQHHEHYDDIGEVEVWAADLDARWKVEQERRRVYVVPDHASFEWVSDPQPVPAALLWEYLTAPDKRVVWQAADRFDQENPGGRRGAGTVNHCVHGRDVRLEEILDWRPFRYFSSRWHVPGIGPWTWTYEVDDVGGGSRVRIRGERLTGKNRLLWVALKKPFLKEMNESGERLSKLIADDQAVLGQPVQSGIEVAHSG